MPTVVITGPDGVEVTLAGIGKVGLRAPGDSPDHPSVLFESHAAADVVAGITDGSVTNIEEWMLDGLTTVRDYAFYKCSDLETAELPSGVTKIGRYAFFDCTALEDFTFPTGLTEIGEYSFSQSGITSADLSLCPLLATIGNRVFQSCESLTSAAFYPSGITTIPQRMFLSCSALTSVTLPITTSTIGYYAFSFCTALASILLPSAVLTMQDYAFADCTSLMIITSLSPTPPALGTGVFDQVPANCVIKVPSSSVNEYKAASGWSSRAAYIQAI